jgi:hypothetical protein
VAEMSNPSLLNIIYVEEIKIGFQNIGRLKTIDLRIIIAND